MLTLIKNRRKVFVTALLVAVAMAAVYFFTRPMDPETAARSSFDAFFRGDVHRLYALASAEERQALNLTPDQLEALRTQVFLPTLGYVDRYDPPKTEMIRSLGRAATSTTIFLKNGERLEMEAEGLGAEEGASTPFTMHLIVLWNIRFMATTQDPQQPFGPLKGWIAGLEHDRPALEAAGLTGMFHPSGKGMVPWDRVRSGFEARLAEFQRQAATGESKQIVVPGDANSP